MENTVDIREINEKIKRESGFIDMITQEMNKVIVGQKHLINSLLIGLLSNGHILLSTRQFRYGKPHYGAPNTK